MNRAEAAARHAATTGRPFAASIVRLPSLFLAGRASGVRMNVHLATTGPEPGNWLISIAESTCRVLLGSVPAPDARLFTDSDIGHSILTGRLSLSDALSTRLLDYDGDPAALRRLGACFDFGGAA